MLNRSFIGMSRPVADRLWEKVVVKGTDECWPWIGARNKAGYGAMWDGASRRINVSRIVYRLTFGVEPQPCQYVCHRCDNPNCCNPAHLFLGTPQENSSDMMRKGRHVPYSKETHRAAQLLAFKKNRKTHCKRGHEFTPENTGRHTAGKRFCKQCQKIKGAEHYQAHKLEKHLRRVARRAANSK